MKSSELFSHPHLFSYRYEPEVVSNTDRDSEAVQLPIFSDRTQSDSTAATPPS